MRNIIFIFSFAIFCFVATAQPADCGNGRYVNTTFFSDVDTTMNITYGSNIGQGTGTQQSLELDVFEPENDTSTARPLIILAHGGSFVGGNRSEAYDLCYSFAKLGYVAVSIEYRTGFFIPNEVTTTLAVMRAMHDMKAAIRFFKKDSNIATFKIDTNRIIIGGISAGAIAAIHTAYLNEESEIPAYLQNDTAGLGGIEGRSGNPGYSSRVYGVVNYAGAIGDTNWITPGDLPIVSFHYNNDQTVPYDTREVKVQGFATGLTASGSGDMKLRFDNVGVPNELTTYIGNGHVDFLNSGNYDLVIDTTANFLYDNLVCKQTTGIFSPVTANNFLNIFPNPSAGNFSVKVIQHHKRSSSSISIYNSIGNLIAEETISGDEIVLSLQQNNPGLYFVVLRGEDRNVQSIQKLIIQ